MRIDAFRHRGFAMGFYSASFSGPLHGTQMTLPPSDHFNGKTFFNPGAKADRGFLDLLKWKLTSRATPWPGPVGISGEPLAPAPSAEGIVATWVGHATFLLRSASATILTDPIFSDRASPVPWAGPRRVMAPGIAFEAIPRVDLVILSHDHFDHFDLPTLRRLARRDNPQVLAPLGHGPLLAAAGLRRVVELDWWQRHPCAAGLEASFVPARHWCRRSPFSTNVRLWGGYMIRTGGRRVYFAGDSGYEEGLFAEIGRRCGAPDLALIPIGAYEPRWFMKEAHMNPSEAVRVHREVGSRKSVAMHWGTFQLTDEGRDEPVLALKAARAEAGIADQDFEVLAAGASLTI
jgi:L-ascorbate metabolism protein UlaG (beta-lactamase superfamily)